MLSLRCLLKRCMHTPQQPQPLCYLYCVSSLQMLCHSPSSRMFHMVCLVISALHLFFLFCSLFSSPHPPQKKDCNVSKVFLSLLHDYSSSLSVWEDPVLLASSLYRFQNPSMLCLKEAILKNNCWANGIMPSLFKDVLQEFSVFDKSVPKDCLTLGRFWLVLVSQECLQLSH